MDSREDRYEKPKVVIAIPYDSPWANTGPVKGPVESLSFIMGFAMLLNLGDFLLFVGGVLYYPQYREPVFSEISKCMQKNPCFDQGFSKRLEASIVKYRDMKQP